MYKKTFLLQQHTPLIHFQFNQAGATLRATEVKPALDRYLLEQSNNTPLKWFNGSHRQRRPQDRTALDYKLHFRPLAPYTLCSEINNSARIPMFFGDLGERKTGYVKHDQLEGVVSCSAPGLMEFIQGHLANFFKSHTFGMRSSKGYGSFSIVPSDDFPASTVRPRFSFLASGDDWKQQFEKIDLFYKSVRGGINGVYWSGKNAPKFYMKPMIWGYARIHRKVWEKRYIKANAPRGFFPYERRDQNLASQEGNNYGVPLAEQHSWPLWYNGTGANQEEAEYEEVIVRDLFGLSTSQSWKGYKRGGNPSVNKTDAGGEGIQRAASPWIFKPEQEGRGLRVNVFVRPIEPDFLTARFHITADGNRVGTLPIWPGFDMDDFINNFLITANFQTSVQRNAPGYGRNEETAFDLLRSIYEEIQRTKQHA